MEKKSRLGHMENLQMKDYAITKKQIQRLDVVLVAEDCDIFVLLLTVFANRRPMFKWSIKYGGFKYTDVKNIVKNR